MATGQGKTTKDLVQGMGRDESSGGASIPRGTRDLRPIRSGQELSEALIQNWEDVCREQRAASPSLSSELETLASDRKSERLVHLWIDEILGADAFVAAPERPHPSFHVQGAHEPTPQIPGNGFSLPKSRNFRLSPGRRAAACLLGVTGILAVAFVAVPSPEGIRSAIFEKTSLLTAPVPQDAISAPSTVSITMLVPGNLSPWLNPEIARFNRKNAERFHVSRLVMPDGNQSVSTVLEGKASPVVFVPTRTGDVERLNEGWLREQHGYLIADIDDPLAFRRVSHHPMVVLNGPWVNARQREGGIAFLEFLAKDQEGSR